MIYPLWQHLRGAGLFSLAFFIISLHADSPYYCQLLSTNRILQKPPSVTATSGMWLARSIGTGMSGQFSIHDQTITLVARGTEGTPTSDRLFYVNYTTGYDFSISVKYRIDTIKTGFGRAGIEVRKNVSDHAARCALMTDHEGILIREYRPSDAEAIVSTPVGNITTTPWLRIDKTGSLMQMFISADGIKWRSIGTDELYTGSSAMVGLALTCQGDAGASSEAYASFEKVEVNFADNNDNSVPDIVETIIGSNIRGLPRRSDWINEGMTAEVFDDYSTISGYEHCTAVRTVYLHGEVEGLVLPVNRVVDITSVPGPAYNGCRGCIVDGGKLHNVTGTLRPRGSVVQAFPLSTQLRGIPVALLRLDHFNMITGDWEAVPVAFITPDAVYANITSLGYYRIATAYVIKRVTTSEALTEALDEAMNSASTESPYAIICEGTPEGIWYRGGSGTAAFTVPANVKLIGGVPNIAAIDPHQPFMADPQRFKSILTTSDISGTSPQDQVVLDMWAIVDSGVEAEMHTTISGFTIRGGKDPGSKWSAGGLRVAGFGGKIAYVDIKDCIFECNDGISAGAIVVANADHIRIERCIFRENRQIPNNISSDSLECGNRYGASAVLLTSDGLTATEASIRNCAFYHNEAYGSNYAGTVTVAGDPRCNGNSAVIPCSEGGNTPVTCTITNCTFNRNRATVATATTSAGAVVKMHSIHDIATVVNSIIWDNAPAGSNAKSLYGLDERDVSFTDINNAFIPAATSQNMSVDPIFSDTTCGKELRLQPLSRCRNAGITTAEVIDDITGLSRHAGAYDMGAYEHTMKILLLDDGTVTPETYDYCRSLLEKTLEELGWEVHIIRLQTDTVIAEERGAGVQDSTITTDTGADFDMVYMLTRNNSEDDWASVVSWAAITVTEYDRDASPIIRLLHKKMVILHIPAGRSVETSNVDTSRNADHTIRATDTNTAGDIIDEALVRDWLITIGKTRP